MFLYVQSSENSELGQIAVYGYIAGAILLSAVSFAQKKYQKKQTHLSWLGLVWASIAMIILGVWSPMLANATLALLLIGGIILSINSLFRNKKQTKTAV